MMPLSIIILFLTLIMLTMAAIMFFFTWRKKKKIKNILAQTFPEEWIKILNEHVNFYTNLNEQQKLVFQKRVHLFLATKKIEAVDTEIDDKIRVLVAASAIIAMFAFPKYNYPNLNKVLIYPKHFDENFQTKYFDGNKENIIGMPENRFINGTMIISKPELIQAYDTKNNKNNVAIHEFVNLIDNVDGTTDGIPEILMEHLYVVPWLHLIKGEMLQIEKVRSDISPYALTSNAEFLAVVSEYFFNDPEEFKKKHPNLYNYLTTIFHQTL